MIVAIPLTIIPLILFNIVAFAFGATIWDGEIFRITMLSGVSWGPTIGDLMIVFAIIMLFLEIMKSAQAGSGTIINHVLSTVVLIIYIIEFIVSGVAANSVFFILTVIALFDVIAGFSISIRTASRDISFGTHGGPPA
jgi:hypothetical protein